MNAKHYGMRYESICRAALFNDKAPDSEFSVTGSGPTWEEQQFFLLLPSRQGFQTHRQSTRSGKNLLLSGFELRLSTLESSALPACHSRAELKSQNWLNVVQCIYLCIALQLRRSQLHSVTHLVKINNFFTLLINIRDNEHFLLNQNIRL